MAYRSDQSTINQSTPLDLPFGTRALIVEARFHADICDLLVEGAASALKTHDVTYDRLEVPGALEIPAAIRMAGEAGKNDDSYTAFIALGCVIRGGTYHYEIVCHESARGIMNLATQNGLAIGNGILTCETHDQALERADPNMQNKGAGAAYAALKMAAIRHSYSKAETK